MTLNKSTATMVNGVFMAFSLIVLGLVEQNVITGKAATITVVVIQGLMKAVQAVMVRLGFDSLPNGEKLPADVRALPAGVKLRDNPPTKVEQEKPEEPYGY